MTYENANQVLNILVAAGHLSVDRIIQAQEIIKLFPDARKGSSERKRKWRSNPSNKAKEREYLRSYRERNKLK